MTLLIGLTGCRHAALTVEQRARLLAPANEYGQRIYVGTVTPQGKDSPQFRYERLVRDDDDGTRTTTHLTSMDGAPVVLQQARQDSRGRLISFDEIHGQRGNVAHVDGVDVVVGPTLFEFVRAHLDELRSGKKVPLVFWSEGTGYDFELSFSGDVVEMRASSIFVKLAIAPMRIHLGVNDEVVEYHGRVPPLLDGNVFDADVTYEYLMPFR